MFAGVSELKGWMTAGGLAESCGMAGCWSVWVFGFVCSVWVACGMWDLGLGLAVLGTCAWSCVQGVFMFGLPRDCNCNWVCRPNT